MMLPTRILSSLALALVVLGALPGCQQVPTSTAGQAAAPFGSLAQITAISPDATQVLRTGEQVRLRVDVSHVLTAPSGRVGLLVLAEDNSRVAQSFKPITQGSGKTTLEAEFTVPATPLVRVFTPLDVEGQAVSALTDGREFRVVPR